MMNGYRESDSFNVSKEPLNKIGDKKPMAEGSRRKGDWSRGINLSETGARCISSASGDLYGGEASNRHSYREQVIQFVFNIDQSLQEDRY